MELFIDVFFLIAQPLFLKQMMDFDLCISCNFTITVFTLFFLLKIL